MKKAIVASLGFALLCAVPVSAQTAERMSKAELIKWASDRDTCGAKSVVDAMYLSDGRVQVTCGSASRAKKTGAGAASGAALAGGLAGGGGALAGVLGLVVVAAAAGGGGSTNSTN